VRNGEPEGAYNSDSSVLLVVSSCVCIRCSKSNNTIQNHLIVTPTCDNVLEVLEQLSNWWLLMWDSAPLRKKGLISDNGLGCNGLEQVLTNQTEELLPYHYTVVPFIATC
jgi:hypothetical protein